MKRIIPLIVVANIALASIASVASASPLVHPGAFCAPHGAHGHTSTGLSMTCKRASDGRYRWKH